MASVATSSTPTPVTIPGGQPVTVSVAVTVGYSSATAASGPTLSGTFSWPGAIDEPQTLFVQSATAGTLNYIS